VYGIDFVLGLPNEQQVRFLVMHEQGHKFLMHLQRRTPAMKADSRRANIAMDYAINNLLVEIASRAPTLLEMIPCGLYDAKYRGWSVLQIFNDLPEGGGGGGGGGGQEPLDEHDPTRIDEQGDDETTGEIGGIVEDLRQGSMLAGRGTNSTTQAIDAALAREVDWRTEMLEWLTQQSKGRDDFTWRKFHRRRLSQGLYMPSVKSEKLNEVVVAIDTSGSTTGPILASFASTLKDFAVQCQPERIRVIWWDYNVQGEQVFEGDYSAIEKQLQAQGGGGTRLSCVSEYMVQQGIEADVVVVFTDGYVEDSPRWDVGAPTLWLVTEAHRWEPPAGRKVNVVL
jgi:predicted metal-dependent peptidase